MAAFNSNVYLDYNATTPVDQRVLAKMMPYFSRAYGNADSRDHAYGWDAAEAVEEARAYTAELIGANPYEIVFTSGATESISLALKGAMRARNSLSAVTYSTEHEAVLEACKTTKIGPEKSHHVLSVDRLGRIATRELSAHLRPGTTALLALMFANNEIGIIHPVRHLADIAHTAGGLFFSDITQAVGKIPINVHADGIDLAAFSAHKVYGPKGVGALFVRGREPKIELEPLMVGGGQERGLRAGTLNVPGIVGFGEACRIAKIEMSEEAERIGKLRNRLQQTLFAELPDVWVNGDQKSRLPNTTNIGFRGVDGRTLIRDTHDIAVSTRSACSSGTAGPSHVLKAIGLTDEEAYSCVRFSLGRFTTEEEIDYTTDKVISSVRKLRKNSTTA